MSIWKTIIFEIENDEPETLHVCFMPVVARNGEVIAFKSQHYLVKRVLYNLDSDINCIHVWVEKI